MSIFEIKDNGFGVIAETTFADAGIREREDIQRLLRDQIEVISPDTLVVAEEFGEWEDSRRRIDLLGVDKEANLIVIELKRTEDGGFMELQALRYAAMVSTLTFEKVVDIYSRHLLALDREENAEVQILEFLGWDEPSDDEFAQDVKIVLASKEFSRELTTSVIWLNERGLDIRCIRMKPYRDGNRILIDVQKVIPLPEAEDYQVKIREKQQKERISRTSSKDFTKFQVTIEGQTSKPLAKRKAIFEIVHYLCSKGITPDQIHEVIYWKKNGLWRVVEGEHDSDEFVELVTTKANEGGPSFEPRRWYTEDHELIHSNGMTYSFTKMWGKSTEQGMRGLLDTFNEYEITYEAIIK